MMATTAGSRVLWATRNVNKRLALPAVTASARRNSSSNNTGDSDGGSSAAKDAARNKLNSLLSRLNESKQEAKPAVSKPVKLAKPSLKNIGEDVVDVKGLEPEVVHAVSRVARATTAKEADDDSRQRKIRKTESELLSRLKSVSRETEDAKGDQESSPETVKRSGTDLIKNMKIARSPAQPAEWASPSRRRDDFRQNLSEEQLQFLEMRKRMRSAKSDSAAASQFNYQFTDPFTSQPPLGIFEKGEFDGKPQPEAKLTTWQACKDREMRILSTLPPRNFLEDMARMTDRGELWHFPIDNEQGVDPAALEPFYDHVFLEHHLEPWCPAQGPLRHFMELVTVGLSKNPHISAQKKVEHIHWYRDYFEQPEHKEILKASGAYDC